MKSFLRLALLFFLLLFVAGYVFNQFINSTTFQVAGQIIPRVNTDKKVVALTFDDGPNENVDEILQILADKNVKATFYLIGEQIKANPDQARRIVAAGHEIGNHSFSHPRMIFTSAKDVAYQIEETNKLIREVGYEGEIFFRPPYGKKLFSLSLYLEKNNIKTIMWDIDPLQTLPVTATSDEISSFVSQQVQPGSIILIHPWYGDVSQSRNAIPAVIENIKKQGYEFVTVSELLRLL
jgi:peptidoglycan/xylan/chitin deacetylase (PgdA/CDA1 family)